jgi:hypothetical protein
MHPTHAIIGMSVHNFAPQSPIFIITAKEQKVTGPFAFDYIPPNLTSINTFQLDSSI